MFKFTNSLIVTKHISTYVACLLLNSGLCFFVSTSYAQTQATDPTRPLGHTQAVTVGVGGESTQSIHLNSIFFGSERKIAIINGQPLHENQVIKGVGAVVKKIEVNAVILQQGNNTWRVSLNKTAIRK